MKGGGYVFSPWLRGASPGGMCSFICPLCPQCPLTHFYSSALNKLDSAPYHMSSPLSADGFHLQASSSETDPPRNGQFTAAVTQQGCLRGCSSVNQISSAHQYLQMRGFVVSVVTKHSVSWEVEHCCKLGCVIYVV